MKYTNAIVTAIALCSLSIVLGCSSQEAQPAPEKSSDSDTAASESDPRIKVNRVDSNASGDDAAASTQSESNLPPGHPPIDGTAGAAGGGNGGMPDDEIHSGAMPQDDVHSGVMPDDATHGGDPSQSISAKLKWEAPEGWKRGADRPMRLVSYQMPESEDAECYITVLGGDGGGLEANINRWRRQFGQDLLSPDDIAGLAKLDVLDVQAPMVDIEGDFRGMRNRQIENARMLGTIALLDGESVYIKLIGPADAVGANKEKFVQFCESLST